MHPDRLLRRFDAWESRTRGIGRTRDRVELEPAYRPLFGRERIRTGIIDDGRVPGFFERLRRSVSPARPRADETALPSRIPRAGDADLAELQVLLPREASVTDIVSSELLRSLASTTQHLAFEIVGLPDKVVAQFVCNESDLAVVRGALRGCIPSVRLVERRDFLFDAWFAEDSYCATCCLGLSGRVFLPLRQDHRDDALSNVLACLDDLEPGDIGLFQVLFCPTVMPWGEDLRDFASNIEDEDRVLPLILEKFAEPTFAAVVRVAALAPDEDRTLKRLRRLLFAVHSTTRSATNELIAIDSGLSIEDAMLDILDRQSRRSGIVLSLSELRTLVHVPSAEGSVRLLRATTRSKAAPASVAETGLVLGTNEHDGRTRPVALSTSQRLRHLHCIGSSGSGKSTLLLSMAIQDVEQGHGFAVLDPHGDLVDDILARIPESRARDVVLFDPSDDEFPIGFNVLSAHSELEKTLLASDFVAAFKRLASTTFGDQMVAVLSNAVLAILESESGGTLFDLRHFLSDKAFRTRFLKSVKDDEVLHYWRYEFPLLKGAAHSPILTRLNAFLRPKVLRYMVAQKDNRLDLRAVMDRRKILLAKLSHGLIGEENAHLLGSLLVAKIAQAAASRQDAAASEREPFFLYIDEFHHFVTPSVAGMLSGARKYGLGLVLAHQEMRQIRSRSEDVASSLLANAYTRVVFQLGEQDARTLADGFSYFEATDFQRLGVGQAIARIERNDFDFNLQTSAPAQVPDVLAQRRAEAVRAFSRSLYARPRREVEQMLVSVPATNMPHEEAPTPPKDEERSAPEHKENPEKRLPGRGGREHKYLQSLVKKHAEDHGFEAEVEKSVLETHGHVDVALKFADITVACEISVTTNVAHEVGNLTKCLAAGFSYAVLLSTDERVLALARDEMQASGDDRVRFFTVKQLPAFLDDIAGAPLPRAPKTSKSAQAASQPIADKGFEGKRMLTTKDAASYLGIAKQTLAKWRLSGKSPPHHRFGSRVLYDRSELDTWIAARKRRSTSDSLEP